MEERIINSLQKMLFWKFLALSAVMLTLTMGKPTISAAHKGTEKICSIIMSSEECLKHC
ncbi:hypothetical protein [Geobacter sp. DSM 9736]|uniref:hypothetical protein n=1 Tax=Geobacter sp. DSM 9736 TaxID=1277350 RepID=UPI000B5ED04B|nr:hypothetical protein [Geobacter sp. DSM 9736]SNB45371.1 hypothetical protein SAMN06269301_0784 [Geobacter sp. DSM 9736]